jgi:hypothetical protein
MKILEHHVLSIRTQFPESDPGVGVIKRRVKQQATRLSRQFTLDGRPVYPGLRVKGAKRVFIHKRIEMVQAVKSGQLEIVPDINEDKSHNFDGECEFCGNKVNDRCVKPNPPYIQSRV